jgi:hypothetical protein
VVVLCTLCVVRCWLLAVTALRFSWWWPRLIFTITALGKLPRFTLYCPLSGVPHRRVAVPLPLFRRHPVSPPFYSAHPGPFPPLQPPPLPNSPISDSRPESLPAPREMCDRVNLIISHFVIRGSPLKYRSTRSHSKPERLRGMKEAGFP